MIKTFIDFHEIDFRVFIVYPQRMVGKEPNL